jgi:SPP1 gp7 family putative phage head morphogenesis protein
MADSNSLQRLLAQAQRSFQKGASLKDVLRYALAGYLLGRAPEPAAAAAPDETKARFLEEQKVAHWKAVDRLAVKWEPKFAEAAIRALKHDKREVLALVNAAKAKARAAKASVSWSDSLPSFEDYLKTSSPDNWAKQFAPAMQGVITDQAERWMVELGISFDVQNLFAQQWFNQYTLTFAQPINETTLDGLKAMLQQAQAEGWSVPEMQTRMTTLFEQWMNGNLTPDELTWFSDRMPAYRTETIARSESMRASNAGSSELFSEWGVTQKEWLSTKDDRTRPEHADANGQVVNQDQPFKVGGEDLMFPLDPNGSPENTINCRCTLLPVIGE